ALLRKILWLCEQVEGHYQQEKEGLGLLDFEDLQLKTLELLKNHADIRNTLRNRYRFIMVDEFQDTNQLQWDIISRIATHEGKLESQKLFVVGDPKQSIYGFRSADVRVFQRVKESFGGPENNIVLGESFRFLPGLNTFINRLFRTVLGDAAGNEFEVPYDHLETRREAQDNSRMELAILDPEWLRENQLSQEHYLASRIRRLLDDKVPVNRRGPDGEALQAIRPGDIAILIPRRTHLLRLESTLREYGVPFKTIGGVGFYRRQEVFDVYHLLRVLDNPGDDLALVALLRSPFAGISDVGLYFLASEKGETYREKLEALKPYGDYSPEDLEQLMLFRGQLTRWEQRRDRLSLSQLLNEIFDESFYRASLAAEWNGEQLLANLDKITEMARDYEQSGFTALADFFESLQQIIDLDPREGEAQIALEDENTIKIMTIHQSKGLEFPVVFCPYLDDPARPDIRQLRFESDLGLAVKLRDAGQQYQLTAPYLFQLIDARQKQKIQAERKRLFYVVVTRARDQVFLSGVGNPRGLTGETALGWAVQAMGLDPEAIPEGEFLWDGQLCINILQRFEANRPAPAGEVDPAAAVAGFR
ncbi:MAG: UvrD-helicase domain-containing protein, partial [Calditrichaeota bacterium]|nr:UvrD-helicase domain-containing protein [Calditrichota bacterium]